MQKNIGKRTRISEKIQVNCKWKLIGICNKPQAFVPNQKLLSNVEHVNKHITGSRRGSNDTPNLSKSCRGLQCEIPNEVVLVTNEKSFRKPTVDDELHKSRKLLEAFDTLNSNSDLFLKLLLDPNSLLMKHIESQKYLQEKTARSTPDQESKLPDSGTSSAPNKYQKPGHTVRKSLFEIMKDQHECPSRDDEILCTSNSVTVPKPSQKEHGRHKLGKHGELPSSSTCPIAATNERVIDNVQSTTVSCFNQRDLEAKKRLSRRLKNVEKRENLSGKESTRTLKRILSSPKDDFAVSSCPQMETELHMGSSSTSTFKLFTEDNSSQPKNGDVSAKPNYMRADEALKTLGSDATGSLTEDLSSDACQKNWKVNDMIQSESLNLSEMPLKDSNAHLTIAEEGTNTTKTRKQYQYLQCLTQDVNLENKTIRSSVEVPSSNPTRKYKVELEERFDDTEEHLSPVSVLDSLFSEDVTSPSSKINHLAKPQVETVHANVEEKSLKVDHVDHKLNICSCIRTVLQASELNWKELSENSRSSGQLLNLFSVDKRDLFSDFLNDILLEVSQHNVECITWSSFIRPDTQAFSVLGKDVVEEVMKEVQWYLVPSILPRKLEHIVGKDMRKPQCWSGTRLDTEAIVTRIVDDVVDELIIQTIFAIEE